MARRIRFPLQTGHGALRRTVQAGGLLAIACPGLSMVFRPSWAALGIPYGTIGVFVFIYGTVALKKALAERASDVLLSEEGLAIEGGENGGRQFAWGDVQPGASEVIATNETRLARGPVDTWTLILALADGDRVALARTQDPAEKASFDALVESLNSSMWRPRPPSGAIEAASRPTSANIVLCASCGAPAVPADAETVRCVACGTRVAIPHGIRARIQAAGALASARAAVERTVRTLLEGRDAAGTNAEIVTFTWCVGLGTMLCGLFVWPRLSIVLALTATATAWFVRARSVADDRVVLRAMVLSLGAREDGPGATPCCRACSAPLPAVGEAHLVVRCVYCNATNVLGLDLGPEARRASNVGLDLDAALVARRKQHRLNVAAIAAAALVALSCAAAVAKEAVAERSEATLRSELTRQGSRARGVLRAFLAKPRDRAVPGNYSYDVLRDRRANEARHPSGAR